MDQGKAEVQAVSNRGCSIRGGLAVIRLLTNLHSWKLRIGEVALPYLFAPPASGLTTTQSETSRLLRIHLSVLGSAYKLSTGTLKKP